MATLTVTLTSALGTNQTALTFSGADSQRIFAAWQNRTSNPGGTQAQFTAWLAQQIQGRLADFVYTNEQVAVVPPSITSQTS